MSKKVVSIMLCMILFVSLFAFSSFAVSDSSLPTGVYVAGYLNFDDFINEPVYSADHSSQFDTMSLKTFYTFPSGYEVPFLSSGFSYESLSPLATFGRFKLYAYHCSDTYIVWRDSILNIDVCSYSIANAASNHDISNKSVSVPFFWRTFGGSRPPTSKEVRVGFFLSDKTSHLFSYGRDISQYLPYLTSAPVPEKPKYSTAKFDLVNTVPNINVKIDSNTDTIKDVTLYATIKLNSATKIESLSPYTDGRTYFDRKCIVSSSGTSSKTLFFSPNSDGFLHLESLGFFKYTWIPGRSYTVTLFCKSNADALFGTTSGSGYSTLDTLTFTVDGTVKPPPDIPVGDTTYSPTPPQTPSTGDVNVITNTSGNITGIQQWDGNQWIIIDKIEIVNNPDSGGGSGGGTTPDKPTDDKGIWDWLFGKIGDLISTIFKGILDILTKCVSTLVDGVIAIIENLFKLLNSVVNFGGDFPKMLQGFFFFLPPEIITLICLMFTLSIAIIIIKFFIR